MGTCMDCLNKKNLTSSSLNTPLNNSLDNAPKKNFDCFQETLSDTKNLVLDNQKIKNGENGINKKNTISEKIEELPKKNDLCIAKSENKETNTSHLNILNEIEKKNEELLTDLSTFSEKNKTLEKQLEDALKKIKFLSEKLDKKRSRLKTQKDEIDLKKTQIESQINQIDTQKKQIEANEIKIEEMKILEADFNKISKKYDKLKKKKVDYKEKIQKLQDKLKDLDEFKKNNEDLKSKYDEVKKDYKEFRQHFGLENNKKSLKLKKKNSFIYDIVININSLKTKKYGWTIEKNIKNKISENEKFSIIGLVGRENIGKTFILNKICEFNLPSGSNIHTKGLSVKYSNKNNLVCLDSAGMQTPVYYYDEKIMERFSISEEDLKKNDEIKHKMIDDRTITDVFIQDFILDVCEVILIVVGQLSQYDQKFIERISAKYKSKKKIIIIHNFSNLFSIQDVEKKIDKDIMKIYEGVKRTIPGSDICEYIEKNPDKTKENISHLVLGVDWCDSGFKYNEITFQYLKDILDTRIDKKSFDIIQELTNFIEENYRLYFQFKKRPKEKFTLNYDKNNESLKIQSDVDYQIANPLFNSLGNLVTNPPYEIFERSNDKYICLIELPDLKFDKSLKMSLDRKKTEFNCLIIQGIKNSSEIADSVENDMIIGTRKYGEFLCTIPLGPNFIKTIINEKQTQYESGILKVQVDVAQDEEEEL